MGNSKIADLPRERRPTLYYQRYAKRFSPIYITTEVDFEAAAKTQERFATEYKRKLSHIAMVIFHASQAIASNRQVNISVKSGWRPRIIMHDAVSAKFTIDKTVNGHRVVVPGVIGGSNHLSLEEIQDRIDYYKHRDVDSIKELKGLSVLRKLPPVIGRLVFNWLMSNLRVRERIQGTFSVTSLGNSPVHYFMPAITSTICFGIGAVEKKPRMHGDLIVARYVLHVTMAFDHNAIDGAMASEVLRDFKAGFEGFEIHQADYSERRT